MILFCAVMNWKIKLSADLLLFLIVIWQPLVAVPSFICADAFNKFLPFCTGFAAGCMIWMVVAEVLPDAFKVTCSLYTFSVQIRKRKRGMSIRAS